MRIRQDFAVLSGDGRHVNVALEMLCFVESKVQILFVTHAGGKKKHVRKYSTQVQPAEIINGTHLCSQRRTLFSSLF